MRTGRALGARGLGALLLVLLLGVTLARPAPAQTAEVATAAAPAEVDFAAWNRLAAQAEAALDSPRTSEEALDTLRAEVVGLRAQFLALQIGLQDRIDVLRQQIAALGPVPEEGQTEAPDIATRRAELNELLAQREAPRRAADEAFARAEAIIRQIDRELRARQANALMTLGPSPLNPANWIAAAEGLWTSVQTMRGELIAAWNDPAHREERLSDLPITLGALALALLMLLRGRRWMEQLTLRLLQNTAILRGRAVAAFFVSLSQVLVPLAGLILLSTAILATRLTGPNIEALTVALVPAGMAMILARWLSLHVFPILDDDQLSLNLSAQDRRRARGLSLILGLLIGVRSLYQPIIAPFADTASAVPVLVFPLVVLSSVMLIRFALVLRRHNPRFAEVDGQRTDAAPFFDRMLALGTKTLILMGAVAPMLGAAGYMAAAQQIVFPAIQSVALIGLLLVLHRLITAIYTAIIGSEASAAQGLIPPLAGLVLSMLAVPPLALIWGARDTDLLELYARFSEGVSLGGARLSPATLLWFLVVFAVGFLVTRALQGALGTSVLPKTTMEKGAQKAIVSGVGYVGITAAALVAFSTAGIDLSGLAIVAGALSVGIGFGLQNIVSNFVSGIILLIERPVSEGDWVEVGSTSGIIQRISVRSTMIETFDRSKVIVPNADLISGAVTNYTKSTKTGRLIVPVGVAYGTDTRKAEAILREIVEAEPLVVLDPRPGVLFTGFGADSLDFEIRAILRDVTFKMGVASEIRHKVIRRFAEEGIEIPFAQRDIWLRNPEALNRLAAVPGPEPEPEPQRQAFDRADRAGESHDETDDDDRETTR